MDREYFYKLCQTIEKAVGEAEFKSEKFLELVPTSHIHKKLKNMHLAHLHSTGGFISGEIKVDITLRFLAGSSPLDLGLLYVCSYSSIYRMFHHVVEHWTCNDEVVGIDLYDQLNEDEGMKNASKFCSKNGKTLERSEV